ELFAGAERLLGDRPLRDVETGADEADQIATVESRRGAVEDVTILAVGAAQSVFELERTTGSQARVVRRKRLRPVVVVDGVDPPDAELARERPAGEGDPRPVEERTRAIRRRQPHHSGCCVSYGCECFVSLRCLQPRRHLGESAEYSERTPARRTVGRTPTFELTSSTALIADLV